MHDTVIFNCLCKFFSARVIRLGILGCQLLVEHTFLGTVVQSIVSVTSSLVVKMFTVLVKIISNSQIFLLKNMSSFCECKSYSHFFSKNIRVFAILNNQSFNNTLTNDIVRFEQLGPGNLGLDKTPFLTKT